MQYCLRCTVVVAVGICCSLAISTSTADWSCERVGKVDNCLMSSVSKGVMPKVHPVNFWIFEVPSPEVVYAKDAQRFWASLNGVLLTLRPS